MLKINNRAFYIENYIHIFTAVNKGYIYKCLYWSSNTSHSTKNVSNIKMKWIFILSLLVLTLSPVKIVAHYDLPYIWTRSLLCSLFFQKFLIAFLFYLFSICLLHYITNASTNSLKNLSLFLEDPDFMFLIYTSCFLGLQYSYYSGISFHWVSSISPTILGNFLRGKLFWKSLTISNIFILFSHLVDRLFGYSFQIRSFASEI